MDGLHKIPGHRFLHRKHVLASTEPLSLHGRAREDGLRQGPLIDPVDMRVHREPQPVVLRYITL